MDFGPSKISLEKIPFWDRHKETPINTSGFQHVGWIVQNTNQHVWILHQSFNRTTTCINISAYYSFWPYHNITPTLHMPSYNNNKHGIQNYLTHVTYI